MDFFVIIQKKKNNQDRIPKMNKRKRPNEKQNNYSEEDYDDDDDYSEDYDEREEGTGLKSDIPWHPGAFFGYWEKSNRIIQRTHDEAIDSVSKEMRYMPEAQKYSAFLNYMGRMIENWEYNEFGLDNYEASKVCPETEKEATIQLFDWAKNHLEQVINNCKKTKSVLESSSVDEEYDSEE